MWITRFFSQLTGTQNANEFVDLFELVAPEDYGDAGSVLERESNHATVVRVVGQATADLIIEAPGANGILWSGAIFTRSRRSVFAQFAQNFREFIIHPESSHTTNQDRNLNLLHPMSWMPSKSWTGAFRLNEAGAGCSEYFSDINRPQESGPWDFDVTQRRRMVTDDSLWLLLSGIFVCLTPTEGNPVVNTVMARTLIHAD